MYTYMYVCKWIYHTHVYLPVCVVCACLLCVCVHVCAQAPISVLCAHLYVHMPCVHVCAHVCVCLVCSVYMCICLCVCGVFMYTHVFIYISVSMHTGICRHMCLCVMCTCMYTFMCFHMFACTQSHTYTYTLRQYLYCVFPSSLQRSDFPGGFLMPAQPSSPWPGPMWQTNATMSSSPWRCQSTHSSCQIWACTVRTSGASSSGTWSSRQRW